MSGPKMANMSLRDYFAAHSISVVMPGLIKQMQKRDSPDSLRIILAENVARDAYRVADAMLRTRQKERPEHGEA